MERSIFAFIWKHSWRQQFVLLGVTVLSFPLLYASLELPKRIINDAIGGGEGMRPVLGVEFTQLQFLALLCGGFLLAVLGQGLMKMQVNTMKGVLAERLLRRFRYTLIHRILRFPQREFRRTSQGELVSMVTAEAEPLGGIMGDLVAQPVFQGGMMLTIVTFLFLQNPWLGLAAVALIPLQAWLIPMLQRRINLLNKARVREVRRLAEQIGENAAGAGELRVHGGWRRKLAEVSARLGTLYQIRYRIYRQKFFMKFINNFITQLTPFFFFSIGGYLAITGDLTVGALVAALAAYKDLSAPWKELLTWYNQTQDMGLRWRIITERFAPDGMVEEELMADGSAEAPRLDGPIRLEGVGVRDGDGGQLLEGLDVEIPTGSTVAITSQSATERRAIAELLARELTPSTGRITIGGQPLACLHQDVIARRIGLAGSRPYLFSGSIGRNISMALEAPPATDGVDQTLRDRLEESRRAGNSADPADLEWLRPERAGAQDSDEVASWWLALTEVMGTDEYLFERGLDARFDPAEHPQLAEQLVALRPEIDRRIREKGLCKAVHRFDPETFNDGLPVAGNLLFATPSREISQVDLANNERFQTSLETLGLCEDLFELGRKVLGTLIRVFGDKGSEHPLFRGLGIDVELYARLTAIEARSRGGHDKLDNAERRLLLTVPFRFSAEQIGETFPASLKEKILRLRETRMAEMRDMVGGVFVALDETRVASGLTVMENALFGKPVLGGRAKAAKLRKLVSAVLLEAGAKHLVAELIYDVPTAIGGSNLPQVAHERIAFVRAAIKRPDILIMDAVLQSHDREQRLAMRRRLREALPDATLIFLEESFTHRDSFDLFIEIEDGRIISEIGDARETDDPAAAALMQKVRKLEKTEVFAGLERRQLRLLAFSARWVEAEAGEALFHTGDPPDGAYLVVKGKAELRWPGWEPGDVAVSEVDPGRMVGDLSVLLDEPRRVDLVAVEPVKALVIDADALTSIIQADVAVATSMLRTVSGYLVEVGTRLREERLGNRIDAPIPSNIAVPAQ